MALQVGQTVYVKSLTLYSNKGKQDIETGVVSKIGNKFFELEGPRWFRKRFVLSTMLNDGRGYTSSLKVYLSMQEIEDEKEASHLAQELRQYFEYVNNLTLDQARRVKAIVDERKP